MGEVWQVPDPGQERETIPAGGLRPPWTGSAGGRAADEAARRQPQATMDRLYRAKVASILAGAVVFVLAVVMGLPAIKGEFVGGDDHRLVLNHVLVNQPSLRHAVELFTIVHRDLYQPIPLLTFQIEFLVADRLNLFAESVEQGAWLFHFDNMWLHGINALLVACVLMMLHRPASKGSGPSAVEEGLVPLAAGDRVVAGRAIAWTAALIFAVHPFQVEVVGWINGRMMLLSTMFALCAMLAFGRWLDRRRPLEAVLVVLCVLLSATSKVRAGVPVLLALVPLARGIRFDRRFWPLWSLCTAIVVGFVGLNLWTTTEADFFAGGASHLKGPPLVRVFLALAFYLEHFLWPVGMSSYYPAPVRVHWDDPATVGAIGTVLIAVAALGFFSWKSRACVCGAIWFFAGIVDTLPFFPARNILAADRYMYLPIIGLAWFVAVLGYACYRLWTTRQKPAAPGRHGQARPVAPNAAVAILAVALIPLLLTICWRVAASYTTARAQAERIAELFPDEPRVWERLGWTVHREGDYDRAIELAERELVHDAPEVRSGAYQLIGLSEVKKGEVETGLAHLRHAVELDEEDGLAPFRLAMAYEELGRTEEAVAWYERALGDQPKDDPTLRRLAKGYRRLGRMEDARWAYRRVLENNPYDVEAAIGLAELAIEAGTAEAFAEAEGHLLGLLRDLPNEPRLKSNLGMIRFLAGEADESMRLAAKAFVALTDQRYGVAAERVEAIAGADAPDAEARAWLLAQLERYDVQHPGDPWTFGLSARLLIGGGQDDAARLAVQLFDDGCEDEACRTYAGRLREMLTATENGIGE